MSGHVAGVGRLREYQAQRRYTGWCESPIGCLALSADDRGLTSLTIDTDEHAAEEGLKPGSGGDAHIILDAIEQLQAYFAGRLTRFDLPVNPGGTDFQRRAWHELQRIPFGETMTYGEQARRMKAPKACRAVGRANGANPIPIIIPCHRVIGADGKLTGFSSGLWIKRWLLEHESRQRDLLASSA
ncbi:MAG: methylated-DNA--[protein]-cysteine S-methyltransferase [Phycisphaeraceae bacterium]